MKYMNNATFFNFSVSYQIVGALLAIIILLMIIAFKMPSHGKQKK